MRNLPFVLPLATLVLALISLSARAEPPSGTVAEESPSRISDEVIPLRESDVSRRTPPIFELGDPFLGVGPISPGFRLPTGAVWNPALQVFGNVRSAFQVFDDGDVLTSEWANRLDIFANVDLTPTERILIGFRPLDDGRNFTSYRFRPSNDDRWDEELDSQIEVFFFEGDFGELFPVLDIEDRSWLDLGFSVGRQQLLAQDGLLINDILDGAGVVRNTARPFGTSNLRWTGFVGWEDVHRGNNVEDDSATLFAILTEADFQKTTLSLDLVSVVSSDRAGDGIYLGAGAVQRIGPLNAAFRSVASIPLDGSSPFIDGGFTQLVEISWTPHHSDNLVYLNAFWGIDQFTSAARNRDTGGPLGRVGILFDAIGLGRYGSPLSNDVDESVGAALGYQWFLGGPRRQLIAEIGGRIDTDGQDRGQAALGVRFQQAVGRRIILQPDLFGAVEEGGDQGFGARLEVLIKF